MVDEIGILAYRDGFAEHAHVASRLLLQRSSGREIVVTVAIPTYRRFELLKEALASAAAQCTDVAFEILVVDNDHESDGRKIVAHLQTLKVPEFRYFLNDQNIGMFGNWNRCLTLAAGKWITILNDDDLLHPTFLQKCLDAIKLNSDIRLIGTGANLLDERLGESTFANLRKAMRKLNLPRWRPRVVKQLHAIDYFLSSPHHGSLGILMRTSLALNLGGYASALFPSADLVFMVRFQQRYGAYYRARPLATYRISVNESLKPTVVDGWVSQGLRLRAELMDQIPLPRKLLVIYSKMMASEVILICRDYFSISFSADDLRTEYGLPTGPVYVPFRLLRMALRLLSHPRRRNLG